MTAGWISWQAAVLPPHRWDPLALFSAVSRFSQNGELLRCFAAPWTSLWPHSDFNCICKSKIATYWTVQAKVQSAGQGEWLFSCSQHLHGCIWNTEVSLLALSTTATKTNQSKTSSWLLQRLNTWSRWSKKRCWRNFICLALRREGCRGT